MFRPDLDRTDWPPTRALPSVDGGRTNRQLLSKMPMTEMLGVEIADYGPDGRTSFALMGQSLIKTLMVKNLGV